MSSNYVLRPSSRRSIHESSSQSQSGLGVKQNMTSEYINKSCHIQKSPNFSNTRKMNNKRSSAVFEGKEVNNEIRTADKGQMTEDSDDSSFDGDRPEEEDGDASCSQDEDLVESDHSDEKQHIVYQRPSAKIPCQVKSSNQLYSFIFILIGIGIVYFATQNYQTSSSMTYPKKTLNDLKETFLTQEDDLWLSLAAGIDDVKTFNRPVVYIFLYTEQSKKNLKNLLSNITEYALCELKDCIHTKPIVLTNAHLNSPRVVQDYGVLIEDYRHELKEKIVMIIEDLQNVPGASARAFHTFCDEYTPLVEKSMFIFTMKVEEFPENNLKFLEEYFKAKWSDIKVDSFNALFTRITNMVLTIQP